MSYVETILGIHFFVTLYATMGSCMGDMWKYLRIHADTRVDTVARLTFERWLLGFDWGESGGVFVFKVYFFGLELAVLLTPNSGASS